MVRIWLDLATVWSQIRHRFSGLVARAYDRGARLEQRIKLMNWWDAQLSQAERGADVIELKKQKA